ncbi:HAMP domain-containing sensor histidine kinase [Sporomusa sp.]|uniref:HAMP domain-containing sensor histidine kinase n=1 Tax=Sporomusa sp. TaxID=2078658 RepID=UPI002B6CC6FC|nr:ATP-binding protein [Sporomusa sp.]HWR44225.1 ATP-binding protein [Sporomusa sp.]
MKWFQEMRIIHKLSLSFATVLFLLSISMGIILWNSMGNVMRDSLETKGIDLAAQLAALSSEPIQTANLYALHELVYLTQNSNKEVRYVFITDDQGAVLVHTFPQGMPKKLLSTHDVSQQKSEEPEVLVISTDEGNIHDVLYPIERGELGYIRVGMHEKTIQQVLLANIGELILTTIFIGAVTLVFCVKLTQLFTKPLNKLIKISESISRGILPAETKVTSGDELGKLTTAINTMTASLKKSEAERQSLLNHLITAQEDERKRISRELHDETSQALTALILSMRAMANQADNSDNKSFILEVRDEAAGVLHKLRDLAVELRPPALDDLGLVAAIQKYLDDYKERYQMKVEFDHSLVNPIPEPQASLAIYRILQESLTNIIKHSGANHVLIILTETDSIDLTVKDNGVGLTVETLSKARSENRLGLYGIQERVEILGGRFAIESEPPKWATVIKVSLPRLKEVD